MKGKSTLPPFGLDMEFGEAIRRFIQADPKEVAKNVAASKERRGSPKKSPPAEVEDKSPKRPTKPLD